MKRDLVLVSASPATSRSAFRPLLSLLLPFFLSLVVVIIVFLVIIIGGEKRGAVSLYRGILTPSL